MILWMLWSIAVATTIAGAGVVIERTLATRGRPARGVWMASVPAVFLLSGWAALRRAPAVALPDLSRVMVGDGALPVGPSTVEVFAWLRGNGDAAVRLGETVAPWAWVMSSGTVILLLVGGLVVLRRRVRRWTRAELEGEEVALSDDFGPALVGVWAPTIVLPRWVLGLRDRDRGLALRHEVEHRDARDTLVLTLGTLAAAAMPWNPAIWFIARRLRQAVEVDCDRRVLRSGYTAAEYGSLLIELSAASPQSGLSVAAMTQPTSLLERRLTMMTKKTKGSSLFGAAGAFLAAMVLLVVACDSPPPSVTAPETEAAIEPGAAAMAEPLGGLFTTHGEEPLIYVDGIRIDFSAGDDLLATINPDDIERIEVVKGEAAIANFGEEASVGVVQIFMKDGAGAEPGTVYFSEPTGEQDESVQFRVRTETGEGQVESGRELEFGAQARLRRSGPEPSDLSQMKIFVDGERVSSLEDVRPEDVERMDVIGGEDGDEIYVTLKRSASSGGL